MKLLIVDDQLATLTGLTQGIDWKSVGFTEIDTAQNAMEARISFARGVPDVMLCDIEMPVETGIDLSNWVRAQDYKTKILFLTCHSDFTYAQEAIRLGVSDYIVQPAPYHRIREKVEKAIREIAAESSHSRMADLGKTYNSRQTEIHSAMLRDLLAGTLDAATLQELPDYPDFSKDSYLVLIQLVQQTEKMRDWNENTLMTALRNTIQDTFEKKTYSSLIAFMDHHIYALAVRKNTGSFDRNELVSRLHYLESMFDMYMPCSLAFYIAGIRSVPDMKNDWVHLLRVQTTNVTGKKGVYAEQNANEKDSRYKEQFYRWNLILTNSGAEAYEKDALSILHSYTDAGTLNNTILLAFHRDFTRLMLSVKDSVDTDSIFEQSSALYTEAMHSQKAMEEMIHIFCETYASQNDNAGSSSVAATIQNYIDEHLSDNIRKEDLAELMHLNEDYLTRIFKKETGMSIKSYIIQQKMNAARELLQTTSLSVSSVAIQLGYTNFSHFSASYKKEFGITPAEEKERGK